MAKKLQLVWKKCKDSKIKTMFGKVCMAAAAVSAAGLLTGFGTGDNRTEKTLKTDDVQ